MPAVGTGPPRSSALPGGTPAYESEWALSPSKDDAAAFAGAHGFAVVRRPTSPTGARHIGDPQSKTFGFWRVAFCLKDHGCDVWEVASEEEGAQVAEALATRGHLGNLVPNRGRFRVRAF